MEVAGPVVGRALGMHLVAYFLTFLFGKSPLLIGNDLGMSCTNAFEGSTETVTFGSVIAPLLLLCGFLNPAAGQQQCSFLIKEGGNGPIVCEERTVTVDRQPRGGTISGATVSVEARRVESEQSVSGRREGEPPMMEEKYTLVVNTRGWVPSSQLVGGRKLVAVNGEKVEAQVVKAGSDLDSGRGVGVVEFEVGTGLHIHLVLEAARDNEEPEDGKITVVLEDAVLDISSIIEDLEEISDMRPSFFDR